MKNYKNSISAVITTAALLTTAAVFPATTFAAAFNAYPPSATYTCNPSEQTCTVTGDITFVNAAEPRQPLYEVVVWTERYSKIEYKLDDSTTWLKGQTKLNGSVDLSGIKHVSYRLSIPKDEMKNYPNGYSDSIYIDGKVCNQETTPADCIYYGGKSVNVKIVMGTATPTPTPVATPVPTPVSTATPAPTSTVKPSSTPTPIPTPSNTSNPTPTPRPSSTPTATPVPTPTPVVTPTPTSTVKPSSTPTPIPTPSNTSNPTPTPRPSSTPTPSATPLPIMITPAITSVSPVSQSISSYNRVGFFSIQGTNFTASKSNVGTTYRSVYLKDYRGVTRALPVMSLTNSSIYVAPVTLGSIYPLKIRDTQSVVRPLQLYVESYDYTSYGRRSLGMSNSVTVVLY